MKKTKTTVADVCRMLLHRVREIRYCEWPTIGLGIGLSASVLDEEIIEAERVLRQNGEGIGDDEHEWMDEGFALFNWHVNNANRRIKKEFVAKYGQKAWDRHIKPHVKQGIMSIFETKPNRYKVWFVKRVQEMVNEGATPPEEHHGEETPAKKG